MRSPTSDRHPRLVGSEEPAPIGLARRAGHSMTDDDFADLFGAYYANMCRLALLMGADDPENVAQEAFARVHSRLARFDGGGEAIAYVRATVCNLSRSRLRHLAVARRHLRLQPVSDSPPSAEQLRLRAETLEEVVRAVGRLSPRQREVTVLRYWADLSEQEIATTLGISTGSVKTHANRAMKTLRIDVRTRQ